MSSLLSIWLKSRINILRTPSHSLPPRPGSLSRSAFVGLEPFPGESLDFGLHNLGDQFQMAEDLDDGAGNCGREAHGGARHAGGARCPAVMDLFLRDPGEGPLGAELLSMADRPDEEAVAIIRRRPIGRALAGRADAMRGVF